MVIIWYKYNFLCSWLLFSQGWKGFPPLHSNCILIIMEKRSLVICEYTSTIITNQTYLSKNNPASNKDLWQDISSIRLPFLVAVIMEWLSSTVASLFCFLFCLNTKILDNPKPKEIVEKKLLVSRANVVIAGVSDVPVSPKNGTALPRKCHRLFSIPAEVKCKSRANGAHLYLWQLFMCGA